MKELFEDLNENDEGFLEYKDNIRLDSRAKQKSIARRKIDDYLYKKSLDDYTSDEDWFWEDEKSNAGNCQNSGR